MREVIQPKPYEPYFRDLDVAGSLSKIEGKIFTEVDAPQWGGNDVLMVNTDKGVVIKINDSLHQLEVEDNKIKFKEIK